MRRVAEQMDGCAFAYYNYRTQEYEYLYEPPTDWRDYIPQGPIEQNLYHLEQKLGKTPIEAALAVLTACLGEAD